MREEEFRQWIKQQGLRDLTTAISANRRVERDEKVDLDEEFKNNGLQSLLKRYTYTTQDERDKRKNPTAMKTTTKSLLIFLSGHKSFLNQYLKFCLSVNEDDLDVEQDDAIITNEKADEKTIIALEAHLQAAFRENITQLDPTLKIIDGGEERKVDSGKIDVLARDGDGRFVVIELKAGTALGDVIGQTLGYMANIAEEEGQKKENVRGIIVAGDFNKRVQSAVRLIDNLDLISYCYLFDFKKETPKPLN